MTTKTQVLQKRDTTPWTCPVCGRPFTALDMVMFEHDEGYQCRHCWNRVGRASAESPFRTNVKRVRMSRS